MNNSVNKNSFRNPKNMVLRYIFCKDSLSLPSQYLMNGCTGFVEALACLKLFYWNIDWYSKTRLYNKNKRNV